MKNTVPLIVLAFFLTDCNDRQPDKNTAPAQADTSTAESVTADEVDAFFDNPVRDMNDFAVKTGNSYMDSLNSLFAGNAQIQTSIKKDLCGGDCCNSFKTMTDIGKNTAFYFFKGDCGEYGFSNDQFFVVNDSIVAARNFVIGIEDWPTDSTATLWILEEKIYLFDKETATIKERKKLTRTLKNFDFTLGDIPYTSKTVDRTALSEAKKDELAKLLATENLDD